MPVPKFGVGASTACEKVNTTGTDENLFRLVPGLGDRVLPLELVTVPAGWGGGGGGLPYKSDGGARRIF